MHVICNPGFSPYLVLNANLSENELPLMQRMQPFLRPLCTSSEPDRARFLEQLPPLFESMIAADPSSREALTGLWEIYATHFDLQRAFPPSDLTKLLIFAHNNALTGSNYEHEKLKFFNGYFTKIR